MIHRDTEGTREDPQGAAGAAIDQGTWETGGIENASRERRAPCVGDTARRLFGPWAQIQANHQR